MNANMKRVKKLISSVICISLLILIMGANPIGIEKAQAQEGVLINVVPSVDKVVPGESFTVNIVVDPNGNNINMIQFDFEFDPSLVQADELNPLVWGNLVDPNFSFSPFIIDNAGGIMSGAWTSSYLPPGTFGLIPFPLATINLTAKDSISGTSYLKLPYYTDYTGCLGVCITFALYRI